MKLLDRYILSSFLYNFFSSFVILMVIFIFQTVWLFIDDLAGKDLDLIIIGKFLFYLMPNLTEKVLPLTVLLASILTFGSFAENYEFAAMKASGISLQRAMRSLIVFVTILGGVTFFFANNVIPASEQKIFNMRRNIAKVKPAAVIVEGVFTDIEGTEMNIKVAGKSGEKDRFLEDVIIHQKSPTKLNTTVIKAKTGELISSETSDIIQLVLNDGHYYDEMQPKSSKEKKKQPFTRSKFETYIKNIDVSSLNDQDLEQESDITTDKMKNVLRLSKDIDSLKLNNIKQVRAFSKNITARMGAFPLKKVDSTKNIDLDVERIPKKKVDTTFNKDDIATLLPEWQKAQLMSNAKNSVTNILNTVRSKKTELNKRYEVYHRHILSLHKKYALAFSCIILFFVGAPLGAIIRKGGLGLPMVIAIILFLVYYFIGVFADNYAKKGAMHPIFGAWLSTLIMLPLGISLTRRATADKGLMSFGNVIDWVTNLFKKKETLIDVDDKWLNEVKNYQLDTQSEDFLELNSLSDDHIIEVVKKYKQFNYSEEYRNIACKILEERNYSIEALHKSGKLSNTKFDNIKRIESDYFKTSNISFVLYISTLIVPILLSLVLPENLQIISSILNLVLPISFFILLVQSQIAYGKIHKILNKTPELNPIILFLIGYILYFILYFRNKKKISKLIKEYA